jgi:multimeric flavodoxin WrbA
MIYFEKLIEKAKLLESPSQKVLAIGGSPRKGGNTDIIIKQIAAGLKNENIESENINLGNIDFKGCIGCERCRKDKICTTIHDGMSNLYPDIIESQGLVLVSPVHNYNITSWMKAFIDRLYCFYEFDNTAIPRKWSSRLANQNRKVVISAICEQENKKDMGFAIEAMQEPMQALGFEIVGILPVFKQFNKGAVRTHENIMDKAYELGIKLGQSLK